MTHMFAKKKPPKTPWGWGWGPWMPLAYSWNSEKWDNAQGHASSRSRAGLGFQESGSRSGEVATLSSAREQQKSWGSLSGCWSSLLCWLIQHLLCHPQLEEILIPAGNWQDISVLASFLLNMCLQAPLGGRSRGMDLALTRICQICMSFWYKWGFSRLLDLIRYLYPRVCVCVYKDFFGFLWIQEIIRC